MRAPSPRMWVSTFTVQRPSETTDAYGSVSASYSNLYAGTKCDVQTRTMREVDQYGKLTARTVYRVMCAAATDVTAKDRLLLTAGQFSGKTIEVVSFPGNRGGHGSQLVLDAEEVEGAF